MEKRYARDHCCDCGITIGFADGLGEYAYMGHDRVWAKAGLAKELICIGCLEVRLGRALVPDDFQWDLSLNWSSHYRRSERLLERQWGSPGSNRGLETLERFVREVKR